MYIEIDNERYDIIIQYKNNRNMYLRIKEDLNIYVTAPRLLSQKRIEEFIKDNYPYIKKKLMLFKNKQSRETNKFRYLGKYYDIYYTELTDITFSDDKVFINKKMDIDKFYKKEAKKTFKDRLDYLYPLIEERIPYPNLKIRKMTSKWGVCNSKLKTITINQELMKYDLRCLDYVIIHELCHFVHQNHSKEYWSVVSKYEPNYKEIRTKLKD